MYYCRKGRQRAKGGGGKGGGDDDVRCEVVADRRGWVVGRPDKGQSILGRFLPLMSRCDLNSGISPYSKIFTLQIGLNTWDKEGKVEFICSVRTASLVLFTCGEIVSAPRSIEGNCPSSYFRY